MTDIGRRAKVRSEFLAGVLQGLDAQGSRLAPQCASRAQPHELDDATGYARCQLQDVIDGNLTTHDIENPLARGTGKPDHPLPWVSYLRRPIPRKGRQPLRARQARPLQLSSIGQ